MHRTAALQSSKCASYLYFHLDTQLQRLTWLIPQFREHPLILRPASSIPNSTWRPCWRAPYTLGQCFCGHLLPLSHCGRRSKGQEIKGEQKSAIAGVMRLQSDYEIARGTPVTVFLSCLRSVKWLTIMVDPRTACTWQRYVNQDSMMSGFKAAMRKLSLLGQDTKNLIDCTDVIPVPKPLHTTAHFPAGSSYKDIQRSVWTQISPLRKISLMVCTVLLKLIPDSHGRPWPRHQRSSRVSKCYFPEDLNLTVSSL